MNYSLATPSSPVLKPTHTIVAMAVRRKVAELVASIPESNQWKVDREIDFENTDIRGRTIPQHLGQIAAVMTNWEDAIADLLGLTGPDTADIVEKYSRKPSLQRREALSIWKSRLGSAATYRALLEVFVKAGRMDCTKIIVEILSEGAEPNTPQAGATADVPPPVSPSPGNGGVSAGSGTAAAATPGQSQAQTPGNATTSTGGVGFSPSMTPDQLAQWLLQEYGEAYKQDIEKLKGALINGELFLELPDDKDWLEELQLSGAFKRLIPKKVKQLKETSATVPTAVSNGNATLPPTETTSHIPLCSTTELDEADVASDNDEPESMEIDEESQGDVLKAWVPKNVLWRGRTELRVKFLSTIPQEWTYGGSGMNVGNIMSWANEWNLRGGGTIPKFTRVQDVNSPSDIRVLFTNDGRRETKIGKRAQKAKYNEATMWLDLHTGCVDDDYKKHIVIHEFGHALGLGHEHQRSDFWKLIKPYINVEKMKKDLKLSNKSFKTNWDSDQQFKTGKCTAYDPKSIMHYWFMKDWLINGYSDLSKVEKDRDSGVLKSDEAAALLGVHVRSPSQNPLADKPSDMDIQLLKDLYGNTSCTILGPPSQPKMLQQTRNLNRVVSDDGGSSRVTLRLLGSLKTKSGGTINIIQQVAPHWQDFAMNLDFDPNGATMQTIEQKNRSDPEPCCREMMQLWLRGMGRQPATFELLVEILRDCNLIVLAQKVEEAIPYN